MDIDREEAKKTDETKHEGIDDQRKETQSDGGKNNLPSETEEDPSEQPS